MAQSVAAGTERETNLWLNWWQQARNETGLPVQERKGEIKDLSELEKPVVQVSGVVLPHFALVFVQ